MSGSAVATVLGGFFAQYSSTLTQQAAPGPLRKDVAYMLGRKGLAELRARMRALNGVAPGATATSTRSRVEANVELGGLRTIESETLINRATTAADVTEIALDVLQFASRTTYGANPPANLDGNPLGTR